MYVTDLREFNYLLTSPSMEPHGSNRLAELCSNYIRYLVTTRTSLLYVSAIFGMLIMVQSLIPVVRFPALILLLHRYLTSSLLYPFISPFSCPYAVGLSRALVSPRVLSTVRRI